LDLENLFDEYIEYHKTRKSILYYVINNNQFDMIVTNRTKHLYSIAKLLTGYVVDKTITRTNFLRKYKINQSL